MAICKFFQQGHCRKGSDCEFEHIKGNRNPFANVEEPSSPQAQTSRRKSNRKQNSKSNSNSTISINDSDGRINKPTQGNHKAQKAKGKQSKGSTTTTNNNNTNPKTKNNNYNKSKSGSRSHQSLSKSFTNLPSFSNTPPVNQPPQTRKEPTVKDYANMVLADLSDRPISWHFSTYGLTLNLSQSLPFPFLGTTEISAEELRLQIYAEAAATGGRIENYVKVVEDMKMRAENQTKALIPQLENVISDIFRANNIPIESTSASQQQKQQLQQQQEALKMTLQQRMNNVPNIASMNNNVYNSVNNSINSNNIGNSQPQAETQTQSHVSMLPFDPLQATSQLSTNPNPNDIIPEDFFTFGSIPEMPPF